MRNYIKEADNKLINHLKSGKQITDLIFPISVKLKPKWLANFLHKQAGSNIIKHRAFFNFKSDHDQMISDYIPDPVLDSMYGDLIYKDQMKNPLFGKNYEFENSSYINIGNKIRDWVSIIYSNKTYYENTNFPTIGNFKENIVSYIVKKKYPSYYTYTFEDITLTNGHRKWYFINGACGGVRGVIVDIEGRSIVNEQCWIDDSQVNILTYDNETDWYNVQGNYNNYIYNQIKTFGPQPRLVSIKIDDTAEKYEINTNQEYTYINAKSNSEPLIFFSQVFDNNWYRWQPEDYYPNTIGEGSARSGECFFDKVNINGIKYPSAARFSSNKDQYSFHRNGGVIFKSNARYQNEPDDQSTILYNISSSMLYRKEFPYDPNSSGQTSLHFVIEQHWGGDPEGELISDGIDITGEANKRVTSTCLTEPYHVTEPINNGEFIKYVFVDETGENPYIGEGDNMYLRLRTSYTMYKNIIKMIDSPEKNNDVIQTITFFETPIDGLPYDPGSLYGTFQDIVFGTSGARRDHDVTELVGGPVGEGVYYEFTIDLSEGLHDDRYSDELMKVLGVSEFDWIDYSGESPIPKTGMKIYVGNYSPQNCPLYNESEPIENINVDFLGLGSYTEGDDYIIEDAEDLYPMIKLNGVQGYFKILEIFDNSKSLVPVKTNTYIDFFTKVETPYCSGMNSIRINPDNVEPVKNGLNWKSTYILKTKGYINAGSQELLDDKNEKYNPRVVLPDSKLVTDYIGLSNISSKTPRVLNESSNKTFDYPPFHVWWRNYEIWPNMQRPADNDYWEHGTINISMKAPTSLDIHTNDPIGTEPTQLFRSIYDAKLMLYANNQKWKFGNKYLSYLGRENPQFIYEMDVSALLNNYTKDQYKNYGIPDNKQFFYTTAKGNSESSEPDDDLTPVYSPPDPNQTSPIDILADMKSDLKIEIWNYTTSKWQKIINTSYSSNKKKKIDIVNDLYIIEDSPETPITQTISSPAVFYKLYLGYYNEEGLILTMPQDGLDLGNTLGAGDNLALYNKKINKSYHISSVETGYYPPFGGSIGEGNVLIITVQDDIDETLLNPDSGAIVNPGDIGSDESVLSIVTPYQIKSGIPDYEFESRFSKADIFETLSLSVNDENIVNSENKVYIRFSLERESEYRMGDKYIQYTGNGVGDIDNSTELQREYSNFPWGDGTTFDSTFDYLKIDIKEVIRRLNAHYISLNNVY